MDRMKSEFPPTLTADPSYLIPSDSSNNNIPLTTVVHLPNSGSIQVESAGSASNEEEPAYQPLEEKNESDPLDVFLASLGITQQHLDSAGIPRIALLQLYRQEFSLFSWWKWCSFDHIPEKFLQWPFAVS